MLIRSEYYNQILTADIIVILGTDLPYIRIKL